MVRELQYEVCLVGIEPVGTCNVTSTVRVFGEISTGGAFSIQMIMQDDGFLTA